MIVQVRLEAPLLRGHVFILLRSFCSRGSILTRSSGRCISLCGIVSSLSLGFLSWTLAHMHDSKVSLTVVCLPLQLARHGVSHSSILVGTKDSFDGRIVQR